MDPHLSYELVAETFQYGTPPVHQLVRKRPTSPQQDQERRYGTYFPSKASFNTKWNFTDDSDDLSTWEFSAPVAGEPMSRSVSTDTCSSVSSSTPAQEIALRYRSGMVLVQSNVSSEISINSDATFATAPTPEGDKTMFSESACVDFDKDFLRVIYRQSRHDALVSSLEEAVSVMRREGKSENDTLVCQRPGCSDSVRNVRALMYHLHIHNIHDLSSTGCESCGKGFDSTRQLSLHRCRSQSSSKFKFGCCPSSPIKHSFCRVFSKISRRSHA